MSIFNMKGRNITDECRGCRGRDRMVVGFTTTYTISAYHHWCCEFESQSGLPCLVVFNTTFNHILVISWWSVLLVERTRGKPLTCLNFEVTDKLYHIMLHTSPWLRFELTTSVVIGTDCIGSCKSNYLFRFICRNLYQVEYFFPLHDSHFRV
jgi:hypothetical protein